MNRAASGAQSVLPVRSRIYRRLYESPDSCSKQALARACSVSMPTLYQNLNELMEEGLVCYGRKEKSTGGRRALGLEIVPDARVAIGVAVTEHHLRLVAVDLRLEELAYRKVPFDLVTHLSEDEDALPGILEDFRNEAGLDRDRILGVGITIPGLITPDHSRIFFAPTLGLRDVPLHFLTRNIPYPVRVENDASASGHADCFVREGRRNLAYLSLENGIGGAVLIDGAPYEGDDYHSGEFGHLCVEPGGLRCTCGRQGCLEAYCSPRRIESELGVSVEDFFRGVEEHRPEYEGLLYDMLRHLAAGVNSIRTVLDCDVVLGGFFAEDLQPYLPILKQYVAAGSPFSESADYVQLSSLRHHIAPVGAALYFVRRFVDSV